jgi:2-polyprenyl-3-methyl-5-hydroxy-6-metoxy-1,4-benzoquinol methylase
MNEKIIMKNAYIFHPYRLVLASPTLAVSSSVMAADKASRLQPARAAQILDATGFRGGLIVHLGCGDGELTAALGAGDRYVVHGLDPNSDNVRRAREHIRLLGRCGRASVEKWMGDYLV